MTKKKKKIQCCRTNKNTGRSIEIKWLCNHESLCMSVFTTINFSAKNVSLGNRSVLLCKKKIWCSIHAFGALVNSPSLSITPLLPCACAHTHKGIVTVHIFFNVIGFNHITQSHYVSLVTPTYGLKIFKCCTNS